MGINVKVQKSPKPIEIITAEARLERDLKSCMRCRYFHGNNRQCIAKDTKDSFLIYHSEHCGDIEVKLGIQQYLNNDRIAICLMHFEDGYLEPVGDLTIDIDAPAPIYCGYLDTDGLFNTEKFVIDNGLGEFTGLTGRSGYREFPLYLFNAE